MHARQNESSETRTVLIYWVKKELNNYNKKKVIT